MQKNPENYRPDIDGLRALAIFLVVAYHYFGVLGGYIGVDIFFVISGYLISYQIITAMDQGTFSLTDFYAKRIRRILPALAFVICTCLIVAWFFLFPTDLVLLAKHSVAGILNVSNILLWQEAGYFDNASTHKPLLHFWSLGIEEQFYIVWPLQLILFFKVRKRLLLRLMFATVSSFVLNIVATHYDRTFAFYMPFTRFWELSSGGMLALYVLNRASLSAQDKPNIWPFGYRAAPWLGLVLIGIATAVLNRESAFPGFWALLPVIGTCLMIAPTNVAAPGMTFLSSKPAVFIGRISFSIYLWHWPILVIAHLLDFKSRPSKLIALALCIVLAWLTCRLIEQPFRAIKVTRANTYKFIWSGVCVTAVIAFFGWMISSGTLHRSWDKNLISRPYEVAQIGCGVNADFGKEFNPDAFARCDKIMFPNATKVMLIGDSHAFSLYQGLKPYLDARSMNLIGYHVLECTPLALNDKRPRCMDYNRLIREQIERVKPDVVILFTHHLFRTQDPYFGEATDYPNHLWSQAAALKAQGVPNVWIMGGIPNWEESLPHAMNFNFLNRGKPIPDYTYTYIVQESLKMDQLLRSRDNQSGVEYISLIDALCNDRGCKTHIGNDFPNDLMVMDYGHLTKNGALFISEDVLGEKLKTIVPR